jgi:hypothetical protein
MLLSLKTSLLKNMPYAYILGAQNETWSLVVSGTSILQVKYKCFQKQGMHLILLLPPINIPSHELEIALSLKMLHHVSITASCGLLVQTQNKYSSRTSTAQAHSLTWTDGAHKCNARCLKGHIWKDQIAP